MMHKSSTLLVVLWFAVVGSAVNGATVLRQKKVDTADAEKAPTFLWTKQSTFDLVSAGPWNLVEQNGVVYTNFFPKVGGQFKSYLSAIELSTGRVLWNQTNSNFFPAIYTTGIYPVLGGGMVFVVFANFTAGQLVALDQKTGSVLWTAPADGDGQQTKRVFYHQGSVMLINNNHFQTFDAATGAPLTTAPRPNHFDFYGLKHFLVIQNSTGCGITAFNYNGTQLWQTSGMPQCKNYWNVVGDDFGNVYQAVRYSYPPPANHSSNDIYLVSLDKEGNTLPEVTLFVGHNGPPTANLIAATRNHVLAALSDFPPRTIVVSASTGPTGPQSGGGNVSTVLSITGTKYPVFDRYSSTVVVFGGLGKGSGNAEPLTLASYTLQGQKEWESSAVPDVSFGASNQYLVGPARAFSVSGAAVVSTANGTLFGIQLPVKTSTHAKVKVCEGTWTCAVINNCTTTTLALNMCAPGSSNTSSRKFSCVKGNLVEFGYSDSVSCQGGALSQTFVPGVCYASTSGTEKSFEVVSC